MTSFNDDQSVSVPRARQTWLVWLGWIALSVAAALLIYRIPLDSDRLYFDQLFSDLRAGGAWSDWRLALAPGYFPDLLFYGLAEHWLPTPAWRLLAVTVGQILACAGAALFLLRQVFVGRTPATSGVVLSLLGLVLLVGTRTDAWLFLNDNNAHVSATLTSFLCAGLLMCYLRRSSVALLPLLALFVAAGWISTQLFALTFVIPVLLLLICAVRWVRWIRSRAMMAGAAVIMGVLLGMLLRWLITANGLMEHKLKYSFKAFLHSVHMLGNTVHGLAHQPPVGLLLTFGLLAALLVSVVVVMAPSWRRQATARSSATIEASDRLWIAAMALYALTSLVVVLAGALMSGGFADDKSMRYLHVPLALAALVAIVVLERSFPRLLAAGALIACVICLSWAVQLQPVLRQESGGAGFMQMGARGVGRVGEEQVAQCLDTVRQQGFTLQAGASQYWFVRGVSYFAGGVPMFSVFADMHPFFWMSTMGPMRRPDHYAYRFNFLIVQDGGDIEPFRFTPEEVGRHAPKPDRVWRCAEAPMQIWWYGDERLDTLLRQRATAEAKGK